jgi:hypothetical protein
MQIRSTSKNTPNRREILAKMPGLQKNLTTSLGHNALNTTIKKDSSMSEKGLT